MDVKYTAKGWRVTLCGGKWAGSRLYYSAVRVEFLNVTYYNHSGTAAASFYAALVERQGEGAEVLGFMASYLEGSDAQAARLRELPDKAKYHLESGEYATWKWRRVEV